MYAPPRRLLSATVAFILAFSSSVYAIPALAALPDPSPPFVSLDNPVSGEQAIAALGTKLDSVAREHGKSAAELKRAL
ncbi:MAG TPA: hypothetical protein VF902_04000, partial [Coriobacteriia bacterium]